MLLLSVKRALSLKFSLFGIPHLQELVVEPVHLAAVNLAVKTPSLTQRLIDGFDFRLLVEG